jgi:hypothetical protein
MVGLIFKNKVIMKVKITFEGDYYEEWQEIESIIAAREHSNALFEVYQIARQQLKHGDSSQAENILEQIMDLASIGLK